jgi:hypothetical protein
VKPEASGLNTWFLILVMLTNPPSTLSRRVEETLRANFSMVVKWSSLLGQAEHTDEPIHHGQEVVPVLHVRLLHSLHQDKKGDVPPEGEIPSRVFAGIEEDGLPLADLEDCPDHADVPAPLLPLPPLLGVVVLSFHRRRVYGIVRIRTFVNKSRAFREQIIRQGWISGRGFLLSLIYEHKSHES